MQFIPTGIYIVQQNIQVLSSYIYHRPYFTNELKKPI